MKIDFSCNNTKKKYIWKSCYLVALSCTQKVNRITKKKKKKEKKPSIVNYNGDYHTQTDSSPLCQTKRLEANESRISLQSRKDCLVTGGLTFVWPATPSLSVCCCYFNDDIWLSFASANQCTWRRHMTLSITKLQLDSFNLYTVISILLSI